MAFLIPVDVGLARRDRAWRRGLISSAWEVRPKRPPRDPKLAAWPFRHTDPWVPLYPTFLYPTRYRVDSEPPLYVPRSSRTWQPNTPKFEELCLEERIRVSDPPVIIPPMPVRLPQQGDDRRLSFWHPQFKTLGEVRENNWRIDYSSWLQRELGIGYERANLIAGVIT